jgi:NADP-dependent 3-hydroxy acid dehydrogenase YdfG/acyl carrier protein
MARWMVAHGAKNLVFLGRSGLQQQGAIEYINDLTKRGVNARVLKCDISDMAQVDRAMLEVEQHMPPIKGLIQATIVMRDQLFANVDLEEGWMATIQPKVQGTWNLHNRLPKDLDFFILLSSIAASLGNSGQAAYSAAVAFQDAFANFRNTIGLTGMSIELGVVSGAGIVAESGHLQGLLAKKGYEEVTKDDLLPVVEYAMLEQRRDGSMGPIVTGLGLDNFAMGKANEAHFTAPFAHFRRIAAVKAKGAVQQDVKTQTKMRDLIKASKTVDEAKGHVLDAILDKVRGLLMVDEVDPRVSLTGYGLDSLVAAEMRNWVTQTMDVTIPIMELLGKGSIEELADKVARQSRLLDRNVLEMSQKTS